MDFPRMPFARPPLAYPLPADHQALMDLFYTPWQAASAVVHEHNRSMGAIEAILDQVDPGEAIPCLATFVREPTQADVAAAMPPKVNAAVLLGNMNYQVHNGGFAQYVDNGYAASADALTTLYRGAGDCGIEGAAEAVAILEEFLRRGEEHERGRPHDYGRHSDEDESSEPEDADYDDLDTRWYDLPCEPMMQALLDRFDEVVAGSFMAGAYRKAA